MKKVRLKGILKNQKYHQLQNNNLIKQSLFLVNLSSLNINYIIFNLIKRTRNYYFFNNLYLDKKYQLEKKKEFPMD
jgi:hypothetical protein